MTLHLTNPTRHLFITLLAVFSMVVAALPTAFLATAEAATTGGFEIDGNYDGAADWAGVPSGALTTINEPTPDIIYGDGNPDGKESGYPDGWTFQEGVANPGKNDLTVGYLHSKTHDDRQWLMIAVERAEATGGGDTDVLVEFNQSDWSGSGTAIKPGGRTVGDLLVQFDLKGQNAVDPTLVASRWTTGGWVPVPNVEYDSAINSGTMTNLRSQTIAPGTFGEVALDLTAVYESQEDPCVTFGSMFARTQSSGGDQDPQLTDILGPENGLILSTCGTITVEKVDDLGVAVAGVTFQLWEDDGDDALDTSVDTLMDTCVTSTNGKCTFSDVEPDPTVYFVREDPDATDPAPPAGYVFSALEYGPFSIDQNEDFLIGGDDAFVNPRIPYQVLISKDSTNHVSTAHTFTVTLQQQLDDVWTAVEGAALALTWTEGTADGSLIQSHTCDSTDSDGTCTVTVYSDDTGTGSLYATFAAPYQTETPVTFDSPTATKTWANYTITVSDDGINLVDHPHTFTVELRREIDNGPQPYADQSVDLKWTDVDGSTTNDTCTTDEKGQCTYTVNSSATGVGTLEASFASTHDEGTVTYTTDPDATKRWVDYELDISDDSVNEVGTSHTFTVTLNRDWGDGNGLKPFGGQTLDLEWAGPTGSTAPTECTTDLSGQCDVEVSSPITGTGLLTAHYSVTLDSGDHTFESPTAEKQWIDYAIEVTPEEADNLLGFDHVFTVSLTTDTGSGFGPAEDELVTLDWDGPEGSEADAVSCVTDEAGECAVTVSSPITGTGTLTASFGTEVDSGTISRSDAGTKTWVDYLIDVDPDRAVNPVGTTHTFTVSLERIEDGVSAPAAGESVSVGIAGPGEIIDIPGGSFDTDGRNGTCTTDGSGQCTVTIESNDVGDTTLAAMYAAEVGETSATFTDSGLKLWRSDPAIELVKEAEIDPTAEGLKIVNCNEDGCDETTFTFTVTNVGGVALHDVTVTDDKLGAITLADTDLEVGESTTGTTTYVPNREEIDEGFHENLGTATGVSPDDQTVRDTDPERVEIIETLPLVIEQPPEPAPEPLPKTGADVAWLTAEGVLAILLGWALVWVGRSRGREEQA